MVVGNEAGSVSRVQVSRSVQRILPLVYRRVETITAVKNIGVRHVLYIALAESSRIHTCPVGIPRNARLHNGVRAIRLCRRVQQRAEYAEISKLSGIWSAVGICGRPHWIAEGIH